MTEVYGSGDSTVNIAHIDLEKIDRKQLEASFEDRWSKYRQNYSVIVEGDDRRVEVATYSIPLDAQNSPYEFEQLVHRAAMLGYTQHFGPIAVSFQQRLPDGHYSPGRIIFCLKRSIVHEPSST